LPQGVPFADVALVDLDAVLDDRLPPARADDPVIGEVELLIYRGSGLQVLPYLFAWRGFAREAFKLAAEAGVRMVGSPSSRTGLRVC
jgi:hypothetical protein